MAQHSVYNLEKNKVGEVELDPVVFEAPIQEHLFYYVINWQLAKRRSGTASTKTRGEVSGGGKKPWRQKHTGRARQGSIRAPQWRKGAIIFGPQPRDWSYNIPKKTRRQALKSALSLKHRDGNILILKDFNLSEIKTKQVVSFLKRFELNRALILIKDDNEILKKSARNLEDVKVLKADGLNIYDILRFNSLVMTEDSLVRVQEVLKN
ncbi:MAG: 50S ribosomal protein L4 [Candidatus Dadabacteria bacterium]|nr:50S ribosomal protein L4 [Candidatus Dadabacteria bacterium]